MIANLGAIASLLKELISLGYKAYSLYSEAKNKGWIKDGRAITLMIDEAKTDEQKANLARRLFEHRPE